MPAPEGSAPRISEHFTPAPPDPFEAGAGTYLGRGTALPDATVAGAKAADAVLLETVAFDRHAFGDRADRQAMHVSWLSGVPHAYALLRHGRGSAPAPPAAGRSTGSTDPAATGAPCSARRRPGGR